MSDLRTAAQQALEALEYHVEQTRPIWKTSEAIAALEAALAEPVQEPVAWLVTDCIGERDLCFSPPLDNDQVLPLYAATPQRKPLTDEEIRDLWSWSMTAEAERTATTQQHAFARAIEAKHGIGDKDVHR